LTEEEVALEALCDPNLNELWAEVADKINALEELKYFLTELDLVGGYIKDPESINDIEDEDTLWCDMKIEDMEQELEGFESEYKNKLCVILGRAKREWKSRKSQQ
jgi:hypothetical protein